MSDRSAVRPQEHPYRIDGVMRCPLCLHELYGGGNALGENYHRCEGCNVYWPCDQTRAQRIVQYLATSTHAKNLRPRNTTNSTPSETTTPTWPEPERCPFHSRAWGCRCDLPAGHTKESVGYEGCHSGGDGFGSGYNPWTGERQGDASEPHGDTVPRNEASNWAAAQPWRVLGQDGEHRIDLRVEGSDFDEVVVGKWLHLERMGDESWWLRIGCDIYDIIVGASGATTTWREKRTEYRPPGREARKKHPDTKTRWEELTGLDMATAAKLRRVVTNWKNGVPMHPSELLEEAAAELIDLRSQLAAAHTCPDCGEPTPGRCYTCL